MTFFRRHKNDILLICAMLLVAAGFWMWNIANREAGGGVLVSVAGEEVMRLPLNEDSVTQIGEKGTGNLLVISGGAACITEAGCPDHICIRRGEIKYDGETIVCLPNKTVVSIIGGESGDADVIAGGQ